MNGRCENDALDGAVDVCDACGGEFCQDCLLFPNGNKKAPLCTACAISTSGVRKAAKRPRLQSKSSASKRRKELRKLAAEQQTQSLVVLDDLPDVDFGQAEEPKPKKRRLRRRSDNVPEPEPVEAADSSLGDDSSYEHDAFVPFDFEADTGAAGPASALIDEIRTNGAIEQVTNDEANMWNFPTEIPDSHDGSELTFETEPDIRYEPEPDFEPEPTPVPVATAEPEPEPTPVPMAQEPAPKWEALHNPDASNPFDDPSAGRVKSTPSAPAPAPAPAPASTEAPAFAPPAEERRVNRVPSPQHRSPSPATTAQAPAAPAPLVQPEPEPRRLKRQDIVNQAQPATPTLSADAALERVQDPTTDTDAAGQWIPPNLRGMVASEEQTELPKRSRRGS